VPATRVSLADAVRSYLFNAQLVTLPGDEQALIVPSEVRETPTVWAWLTDMIAGNGPIRRVEVVDVRESMANGGGPACLRLRVVADPATVDPRFLVNHDGLDAIAELVSRDWPETIHSEDIANPALWDQAERARRSLLELLGIDLA
jgi:succinylarginine dihydrolase